MALVSILLPAFFFEDDSDIPRQISKQLGMKSEQFQVVSFADNYEDHSEDNITSGFKEYGIKMINSDLSLRRIESILEEQNLTQKKVEKCKEALTTLSQEFNNLVSNPNVLENLDNQKLAKRTKKLKQVKDDNRKLRSLLKVQLDNSEKMRLDTQITVETLREEFDLLVRELSIQKNQIEAHQQQPQSMVLPQSRQLNNIQQSPQQIYIPPLITKQQQQQQQQQVTLSGGNNQQSQSLRAQQEIINPGNNGSYYPQVQNAQLAFQNNSVQNQQPQVQQRGYQPQNMQIPLQLLQNGMKNGGQGNNNNNPLIQQAPTQYPSQQQTSSNPYQQGLSNATNNYQQQNVQGINYQNKH